MIPIQVTNTLTGKKEPLKPLEPGHVRMYACGVTVYDHCHIGHAMQAIYFDVIRNYLEAAGYKVTYVRNYTDVDDKIINRAQEMGISPLKLSEDIINSSRKDMMALGIRAASHEPKVSDTIPEIIAMIAALVAKGFAYAADGDVYYRVRAKKDYGKLSNRKPDELRAGTRDLVKGEKEDELDFALWKRDETEGASWDSPWGRGRPGWHIECSAMAKKFLGDNFDIHGGGRDLVFPHHENEIAQSEAANSCPYATIWIHSGLLTINKQKMSKSLGNHILINEFLKSWPAEVLRLAYLQQQYTSNTDFSDAVFQRCAERLLYFYESMRSLDELAAGGNPDGPMEKDHNPAELMTQFHRHMADDFNTVNALADINVTFRKVNDLLQGKKSPTKSNTAAAYARELRKAFHVFGMMKEDPAHFLAELKRKVLPQLGITENQIEALIAARATARQNKDWAKGDEIRNELTAKGIELMDAPGKTEWRIRFREDEHH